MRNGCVVQLDKGELSKKWPRFRDNCEEYWESTE